MAASSLEGAAMVSLQELLTFCIVVIELIRISIDLTARRKE